jgi:hypothetical protein
MTRGLPFDRSRMGEILLAFFSSEETIPPRSGKRDRISSMETSGGDLEILRLVPVMGVFR